MTDEIGRNFRDVGGIRTPSGYRVRRGRLFRSAVPAGAARFEARGIRRVVDLRASYELSSTDYLSSDACERHHLPLFETVPAHWIGPVDRSPRGTAGRYLEMARMGGENLVRFLGLLNDCDARPTLVHCVAGRDRTGIAIACLLDLLGVADESIAEDYALSHVMDDGEGRNADPENIRQLLRLVRGEYGSVEGMLLAFGGTPELRGELERALLEPGGYPPSS